MAITGNKFLEERLRQAASAGDVEIVQSLLTGGVDVNSQNGVNGWSALHWAAHRNYIHIVDLLLKHGADKTCLTKDGESPYKLSSNREIQILLEGAPHSLEHKKLPITPNYLINPPLVLPSDKPEISKGLDMNQSARTDTQEELVLKVRLADSSELDFIEIELQKKELTFTKLLETCCEELSIPINSVAKIRKLPNTILRKDKDVQRLNNLQELEVVTESAKNESSTSLPSPGSSTQSIMTNRNQYESISLKKDQTVLY